MLQGIEECRKDDGRIFIFDLIYTTTKIEPIFRKSSSNGQQNNDYYMPRITSPETRPLYSLMVCPSMVGVVVTIIIYNICCAITAQASASASAW